MKEASLTGVEPLLKRLAPFPWRQFSTGLDYDERTAHFICDLATAAASYYVVIDGANDALCALVRSQMRRRRLTWKNVTGARDESEPMLRLADALVGFLGDVIRAKPYAVPFWKRLGPLFAEE